VDENMNEAMRAELESMDGEFEDALKDDSELNFRVGEQDIYISDYHFDRAKKGNNAGKPILILELRGAEKKNKKASADLIFILSAEKDKAGQFMREKLKNFLWGFGVKTYTLSKLDAVFAEFANKVFSAKIDFDKNGFISVSPQKLKGDVKEEVDDGSGECPF
jgi:hypothetical protein